MVKLFILLGAHPSLCMASQHGFLETTLLNLQNGAQVNPATRLGRKPLYVAPKRQQSDFQSFKGQILWLVLNMAQPLC
ncbi:unnamed protein product [Clonostachys rosea f. rosea IK726]|uniref:Uncharacterized protein n=1 Tax=Clonostachys rosea f. rosea IK726 TaxID=1349383 RepID=A0ACA9TV02_BIOOC|nr:unnamed protein product [Clonostachys rosea f. rosea IK726]